MAAARAAGTLTACGRGEGDQTRANPVATDRDCLSLPRLNINGWQGAVYDCRAEQRVNAL